MKNGKKVLPALLAAALLTSGGVLGVDAASINGKQVDSTVTNQTLLDAGSGKLLVGQGNLDVQTDASVGNLITKYEQNKGQGTLDAIQAALAPSATDAPLVGVIGGEMQIDNSTYQAVGFANILLNNDIITKVMEADTLNPDDRGDNQEFTDRGISFTDEAKKGDNVAIKGDIKTQIGGVDHNPLILGFIGGDASLNGGTDGYVGSDDQKAYVRNDTTIARTGNINGTLASGNVLLGAGGSAAISVGNINVKAQKDVSLGMLGTLAVKVNADLGGKTTTTLDGNVTYNANGTANLGVWANGGAAVALGGESTSTVTGTSTLTIDHTGLETKQIDGVTGMVAGGGASVSTLGGTATTSTGDTTISINNALTGLVAGGGAAVSLDATEVYNTFLKDPNAGNVGNDNGTSDIFIGKDKNNNDKIGIVSEKKDSLAQIYLSGVNQGGTATAKTGNTNITLTGNSTALITAGGGVAGAWHGYTNRDNTDGDPTNNGQPGGTATAKAESGDVTIDVNLDTKGGADAVSGVKTAVSAIKDMISGGINTGALTTIGEAAGALAGKGMAVGTLGGGVAVSVSDGGTTTSSTVKDVTINLNKGYAVGTFGGGLSVNEYNKGKRPVSDEGTQMKAYTEAASVKINVAGNGANDNAVGVFGGGVAVSGEYDGQNTAANQYDLKPLSESVVKGSADITVTGKADGVFGGGMAVSSSNVVGEKKGGVDALASVGTANIKVDGGTVNHLNIEPIMAAVKNTNGTADADQTDPNQTGDNAWWSILGQSASRAMADLKGITDSTAITGGGMSLGMSSKAGVTTANISVTSGTVNGDILGGGIAVDNMNEGAGASVDAANITLGGGTVNGSVYAGGAISKSEGNPTIGGQYGWHNAEKTASTVGTSNVTLSGTEVTGEISGQGYDMTTKYQGENNYNPFFNGTTVGDKALTTYEKALYKDSVGTSKLTLSGTNTLSALTGEGYTSSSKIHDFNEVNVEAGSVTKVTGDYSTNALISGGKVTVAEGAKLDITGATNPGTVKIAANTAEGSTFWANDALQYDRLAGYADGTVAAQDGGFSISYTDIANMTDAQKDAAADEFGDAMGAGPLHNAIRAGYGANWDTAKGVNAGAKQFFTDWNDNKPALNAAFGRAAMIGEDAAATGNTLSITRDMADNVMSRLSFTEDPVQKAGAANETSDIWAKYVHNEYKTDGAASAFGGISSKSTYDGAIVGVDFTKKGKLQTGAAFHYGSGDGSGSISSNDFDAYGFTLYGSLKDEAAGTNLMADIGYVKTSNDITGHVNGKTLTADRDITAWTVGLRGEKEYVKGTSQLVPYAGLRYVSLNPSAYDSYYGGQKLFHNDADNQNLWLLPVGVALRNETVTKSGWTITPKAELAYIFAFGDKDTDVDVDLGTGSASPLFYTVTDDGSWLGSLAVEAKKDIWTFGAGYSYQKGDDTKNEKWFVNASYAF